MNKTVIIAAVIIAIIIIVGGVYVLGSEHIGTPPEKTTVATTAPTTAAQTTAQTTANQTNKTTTMATTSPTTAATTTAPAQTAYTVKLENSSALGTYLTNASGFTLYTYSSDTPNSGTSSCTGGCASIWPPFYVSSLVLPPGLNASSFATITRTDGSKQLAYKGYPLYLYTGDSQPGQASGNNVAGFKVAVK